MTGLAVSVSILAWWYVKKKPPVRESTAPGLKTLGEDYTVFSGIDVPAGNGMCRIDHVVVSPFGIFVLKEIDAAGSVRGDINAEEWELSRWRNKDSLCNPVWRVRTFKNALEEILGEFRFVPLVVFLNANLKNDLGPDVLTADQLTGRIRYFTRKVLSPEQCRYVIETLTKTHGPAR